MWMTANKHQVSQHQLGEFNLKKRAGYSVIIRPFYLLQQTIIGRTHGYGANFVEVEFRLVGYRLGYW